MSPRQKKSNKSGTHPNSPNRHKSTLEKYTGIEFQTKLHICVGDIRDKVAS